MKLQIGRKTVLGTFATLAVAALAFAVVAVVGITGWEYTNSNEFCAAMCHNVHPEESRAHAEGAHARVNCVECHMGRNSTLRLIAMKPTHLHELWGMVAGYERPLHAAGMRPAREACESCHWPETEHQDRIIVNRRFATDAASSEVLYRLTMHTTADAERDLPWKVTGIHWHIANKVEFKTGDRQGRVIPWVRVTRADGTTSTYIDGETKLTAGELDQLKMRRMECFDCHNQVGHPFPNPADRVDAAIAAEKIDRALPAVKSRAVALINAAQEFSGPLAERTAAIDKLLAADAAKAAVKPELKEKDLRFQQAMRDILIASSFEARGLSWQSFPNHGEHRDTPGCFRCHNGKHFNEKGEAIRLQCTLCHNLPTVTMENGKGSVPSLVVQGVSPPDSHHEPNFMHEHRFKLDDSCSMCHGKLEFGREGGNFCANPACHGRAWPGVNLNVDFKPVSATPPAAEPAKAAPAKAPEPAKSEAKAAAKASK